MNFKLKASTVLVGISILTAMPTQAASLRDIADEIYGSFTTSGGPDNFRTNNGDHVFTGGAYSLRFKTEDIKLIDFQPPSSSASCSGIDFYAGSIQFASKDQFIQAGRNIAAAATVYAFRLALNSVCASCNAIMQNIQAWIQKVNDLANMTCQDSLAIMEASYDSEKGIQGIKGWESSAVDKVSGWAETTDWMGLDTAKNTIERWKKEGIDLWDDVVAKDKTALASVGDPAYLLAYNSDVPKLLFPFYANVGDLEIAQAATWSIFSEGKLCMNLQAEEVQGSFCGISDANLKHNYIDFIRGNQSGDMTDVLTLGLPRCKELKSIKPSHMPTETLKICNFADGKDAVDTHPNLKAKSISGQIMGDVFGTDAVDAKGGVDMTKVCDKDRVIVTKDSFFAKQLRFSGGGSSLNPTQLYIASILGTTYSRDLYRLNAEGKVVTDVNENAGCGQLAKLVFEKTDNLIDSLVTESISNLIIARQKVSVDPKFQGVWPQLEPLFEKIENSLRLQKAMEDSSKAISKSQELTR